MCSVEDLWDEVQFVLKVVQTAACLEIVHSMVGLVKSPWFTTFLQGTEWLPPAVGLHIDLFLFPLSVFTRLGSLGRHGCRRASGALMVPLADVY